MSRKPSPQDPSTREWVAGLALVAAVLFLTWLALVILTPIPAVTR